MSQNKKNKKQKKGYYKKDIEYQPEQLEKDTKYEISSDEEEPLDFSYLLNLHASSTSHLILKSDQQKFHNSESIVNTSKYFSVDINLLNSSIKSLPFCEVHQIEGINWSSDEIDQMKQVARANEDIYKTLLLNLHQSNSPVDKVIEKVENLAVSSPLKKEEAKKEVDSKKSMEEWLDDVLDI